MDVSTDFMFGRLTNIDASRFRPGALDFTESFGYTLLSAVNRSRMGWMTLLLSDKKFGQATAVCR
ncbi:hypothetical protein ACHAPJ_005522 [Fusarium lateritium]